MPKALCSASTAMRGSQSSRARGPEPPPAAKHRRPDMKLYYSPGACSLAPHIVAREAGLAFDLVKVDLAKRKTETGEDYLAINPRGLVPAIQLDDGEVHTEAAALVQYLAEQAPQSNLAPPAGSKERFRV